MNYAELFRVTLPETALEIAALLVLVVDLGLLRKAALNVRAVAAMLGVRGCGAAILAMPFRAGGLRFGVGTAGCCWRRAGCGRGADWDPGSDGVDASAADRF